MRPRENSIFLLKRRAAQCAKKRCAIGQSQKLDFKNYPGILAALRFVAGASATIGGQMLPALAIGSKTSLDSIQTFGRPSDTPFRACRNSLFRANAQREGNFMIWVWIGHHSEYDALLRWWR